MPDYSITVNDIVRRYWGSYCSKYKVTDHERKVMRHISQCRTEDLGARIKTCDACGYKLVVYNSCRDRNCPQCQSMKKEKWILDKKQEVFPFPYFHVVFTLPDKLNEIVYGLLFEKVKETILSVAGDKKYFGAAIGFFSILHTWGQKLNMHPHLHLSGSGRRVRQEKEEMEKTPP